MCSMFYFHHNYSKFYQNLLVTSDTHIFNEKKKHFNNQAYKISRVSKTVLSMLILPLEQFIKC